MTETQTLLDRLGWTRSYAALRLGVTPAQMRWWAVGINTRGNPAHTPPGILAYLRRCAAAVDSVKRPALQEIRPHD